MLAKRAAATATFAVVLFMAALTPAWADDPNYPPGVSGDGAGVAGVKSGVLNGSGLPHTGVDLTVLWVGLAVLLLGMVLLATTRRRDDAQGA